MGTSNVDTIETTRYKMKYKQNPYISKSKNNDTENINNSKEKEKEKENESIGESLKENEKATVTIKVKIKFESGIWEKEYNVYTILKQIDFEFKKENNLENMNDNKFIQYIYNNSELIMDSTPLKKIIKDEEQNEILIEQIMKEIKNIEKDENIEYVDYIAKPMANPFEVYIFGIRNKLIKKIKYTKEKVEYLELDKYDENSAYCNGINQLFISGGIDPKTNQKMDLFLGIDIENNKLINKTKMPIPKKNHKMIYYNKKVYIIGGDEEKTMFYDTINMEINEWDSLNQKKFETSLIIYNSYLFCFDLSGKNSFDYVIEKIDLSKEDSKWEIVRPEINPDISKINYSNKFFGLIKDNNENIIFLGGKCDTIDENNNFNLQYNVKENIIEKNNEIKVINNYEYKDLVFIEKSFLSFDENTQIIFPDFIRGSPKILYYYKDRKCLEIILYHSNKKLKKLYNDKKFNTYKKPLKGLNANTEVPQNNNNLFKTDEKNFNKQNNFKKDNNINIIPKMPDMKNFNTEETNNENENNNKENIDVNLNNINLENNKKEKQESNNVKSENRKHSNDNSNHSVNNENEIKSDKSKENNIDKNSNNKKSNIEENNKSKSENNDDLKEKEETEKKEEIKDKEEKENQEDKENQEEKNEKEEKEEIDKNKYKELIYDHEKTDFHSSVNFQMASAFDKLNNNKAIKNNIKKLNIVQPENVNIKLLKKARRQFNIYEISESDDISNY